MSRRSPRLSRNGAPSSESTQPPYKPHYVGRVWVFCMSVFQALVWILIGFMVRAIYGLPWHYVLVSEYVCETLALLTHWMGHRNIIPWWYDAHTLGHHMHDYPSKSFLSPAYEPAKKDNSQMYAFALFLTPLVVASLIPGTLTLTAYLVGFSCCYAMLIVADTIHMALHVNGHPWEKFGWFLNLRALHYWHHKGDMRRNYAIGDFFLDWALLGIHF